MHSTLARNIAQYRKALNLTQEDIARPLGVTFQAVSKWETGVAMPDVAMLPLLANVLMVSIDKLLGYTAYQAEQSFYEDEYRKDTYFWDVQPSDMCLKILELMPPTRPLKLLDIGCGEGKDAVFFARCGYQVSAFDISDAGLDKLKRLADKANVYVHAIKANLWDYRLDDTFDILYSSGVFHYMMPELRDEIVGNYRDYTSVGGINAFHVFVEKPFIDWPPEKEPNSHLWLSGELMTYYHDWFIESCSEYVFDCDSSGIPHQHAANRVFARRKR